MIKMIVKKIKSILKEKKGVSTLEFVICLMIFILIFTFMYDLILITYKQYTIAEETSIITRQIARQSGVLNSAPSNYPGGDANYYTANELRKLMQDTMDRLHIDSWTMTVTSKNSGSANISSGRADLKTEYREPITVEVNYNYKWGLWSQMTGIPANGNITVNRSSFSEYNHDFYDDESK